MTTTQPATKLLLPSGDGHVGAPTFAYREYLEKALHPTFDDFYKGHKWRWSPAHEESYFGTGFHGSFVGSEGFDPEVGTAVTWDPKLRLKIYDDAGVAGEVLHPDDQSSNDPPFGSGLANAAVEGKAYPPELVRAGARAYNRWLADFCSEDPTRLMGLIALGTLNDPVWCVDEIHRAYESGLTTGILLPLEYYEPLYHHARYDILWETCVELNLAVNCHLSKGMPTFLGDDPYVERFMYVLEGDWFSQRPAWCLIMGGILERFPTLQVNFAENGIAWVNPLLERLDGMKLMLDQLPLNATRDVPRRANYSMTPSEYFTRQCAVVHSAFQARADVTGEVHGEIPNLVWGGDIGHGEGMWPVPIMTAERDGMGPRASTIELVRGMPEKKVFDFLTDNFFKAYPNANRAKLQEIADRIGIPVPDLSVVAA
ncbi:hypothetical protein OPAG_06917 [Rhodococcus opacus PD630]|uniref:amidohydrolase family protein n=1 Tax=Rhodococcus opacus TaxID=37919 RepID=UPI00029CBAB3|nr:amidohydrolase family protein [Rhodococcus opacus]AHK36132.1 hypothetical protein Pd630_LPD16173 [Rhodococcus opacus PD630]EHI43629.1 hypothetical protein OPAG_06917 [Rhodococcus opacus PD630]UDH01246.1 amidohydrolase [Rhodococcus opacus PD630]